MARPPRIELPGGLYHVMSRGRHDGPIYENEQDRRSCLALVAEAVERYDWRCYAYCQMIDHYHLVLRTIKPNLSAGMRFLNGVYTQDVNRRHCRSGPVLQGRYKTVLVDPIRYFLPLCRYIVLNPVRAGLVPSPGDWPWSSYRATVGEEPMPSWLSADSLLIQFSTDRDEARSRYRDYVAKGAGERDFWQNIRLQRYLGDEDFVKKMQAAGRDPQATPANNEARSRVPSLAEIAASTATRNEALVEAYATGAYSYADLARYFGLHPGSIGRIVNAGRKAAT